MVQLDFQPKMVGREKELEELKRYLNKAKDGQGNTIFISGEAGIGKTRLVNELKDIAKSQGYLILSGNSLYESLTPYMPFMEALRSGGLESLFAEEAPKVEAVYLVTHSGLLVKEVLRQETGLNPDIFSGMLITVSDFVRDSLSMFTGEEKEGSLNTLGYENYRILIEGGKNTNLAVILTGKENEFLINDMKEVLVKVNNNYGEALNNWDGEYEHLGGVTKLLEPLIGSGKYEGIDYAKDNPEKKRNRLFENIFLGLERHTKVNSSLLCIEDLQWSDPSTLALLHYVARNTRKCNLVILGTYRPEDVIEIKDGKVHPLIDAMQLMSRENLYQKIELQRLEEKFIGDMLSSLLGETDFKDEFKKKLYMETEGNPFFIISLIRMLIEEGSLKKKDDIWILIKDVDETNIPSKVHEVIERRLSRVKQEGREILEYAAVIGDEFNSDILACATELKKIQILKQLRILEESHKLICSSKTKYKFDHSMIKEVLYKKIPEELRVEYHANIADSIETLNKNNLESSYQDLAFHYYRSRDKEKAPFYLIKAAEQASKKYSNEEAMLLYNQALELEENEEKRMEIFESQGDLFFLIGDYNSSLEMYNEVLKLQPENYKNAEIIIKIGDIYHKKGIFNEAINKCNEALDLVNDKSCKEKALALKNLGLLFFRLGESTKAIQYLEDSIKISVNIDDPEGIATSCRLLGGIQSDKGEFDKALENFNRSYEISKKIDKQNGVAGTLRLIGRMYISREEYALAQEFIQKGLEIFEKIGEKRNIAASLQGLGVVYMYQGEYDKAQEAIEQSLVICEQVGLSMLTAYNYMYIADAFFLKNDLKKAHEYCMKTFNLSKELGLKDAIGWARFTFGKIYREQKMWKESIENFDKSIKILNECEIKSYLGKPYYEFGLMWKEKGDIDKAKEYLNKALFIFEKHKLKYHLEKVKATLKELET